MNKKNIAIIALIGLSIILGSFVFRHSADIKKIKDEYRFVIESNRQMYEAKINVRDVKIKVLLDEAEQAKKDAGVLSKKNKEQDKKIKKLLANAKPSEFNAVIKKLKEEFDLSIKVRNEMEEHYLQVIAGLKAVIEQKDQNIDDLRRLNEANINDCFTALAKADAVLKKEKRKKWYVIIGAVGLYVLASMVK